MIETEHIKTLERFGLSRLQAKTYLSLLVLGQADVKTIARESDVARQEIYRIMPTLEKIGLEEKILGKPIIYRATPLSKALAILAEQYREKYEDILERKKWLLDNFPVGEETPALSDEDSQFSIISEPTLFVNLNKKLIERTEKGIDTITPLPQFCHPAKLHQVWTHLEKCLPHKKGLVVRVITEKSRKNIIPKSLTKQAFIEIRYLSEPVRFGMHIFDDREMTMTISQKSGLPSLWSNNQNQLKLATKYFENLWSTTTNP
jgi:sugar-specific transcriptional regulator TrmB